MERDPVLAKYDDGAPRQHRLVFTVRGGLHFIRGNRKPHFSITASGFDRGSEFGGCCHETILEQFPQFADLVALHLSDIDGVPMYAVENGFYHLGGTHWQGPKFKVAADHFRISEKEAESLVELFGDSFSTVGGFMSKGAAEKGKAALAAWVDGQRARWAKEAADCIVKHGLVVYGDAWPVAA